MTIGEDLATECARKVLAALDARDRRRYDGEILELMVQAAALALLEREAGAQLGGRAVRVVGNDPT
jgi:hypothetical protein